MIWSGLKKKKKERVVAQTEGHKGKGEEENVLERGGCTTRRG